MNHGDVRATEDLPRAEPGEIISAAENEDLLRALQLAKDIAPNVNVNVGWPGGGGGWGRLTRTLAARRMSGRVENAVGEGDEAHQGNDGQQNSPRTRQIKALKDQMQTLEAQLKALQKSEAPKEETFMADPSGEENTKGDFKKRESEVCDLDLCLFQELEFSTNSMSFISRGDK